MAEDEKAEENLSEALQRVVRLPWPSIRDRILWNALTSLCRYFKLEIVTDPNPSKSTGLEKPPQ